MTGPHPRWEEFEGRLADLFDGEFKLHGEQKLKQWLRDQFAMHRRIAERLHRQRHVGFLRAVADAEKCLSLLHTLEGLGEDAEVAA